MKNIICKVSAKHWIYNRGTVNRGVLKIISVPEKHIDKSAWKREAKVFREMDFDKEDYELTLEYYNTDNIDEIDNAEIIETDRFWLSEVRD